MKIPDVKLEEVRNLLRRRCQELANRANRINRDLGRADEALSADFSEQAVQMQNDEALTEIGRSAAAEMECIDEALARVAAGEYGTCKRCGQLIDAARLKARPEAVTCIGCDV